MAIANFTGSSQLDDSVQAEGVAKGYVQTAYQTALMDNFVAALGGHDYIYGSKSKSYVRLDAITAAALTEGTDASVTQLGDSQRSISISECGIGVAYGDVMRVANAVAGEDAVTNLMAKAYAAYLDITLLALNSSFTDTVGTYGGTMTLDYFLQAIHELEENQCDGPFFSVLGTTAIHTLRTLTGGTSATSGAVFTRAEILDRVGPAAADGLAMTLYEVPVFKSVNCPADTSGASEIGVMLPMNSVQFPVKRVIGLLDGTTPWDLRYEEERDASGRLKEKWLTGDWGVGLVALDFGVQILTAV